jgi:DNA repair exonuclease SbcCD ATPase subunit
MNQLQSLHLQNVVSFKDTKISITDNNGFVVIQGKNLDSNIPGNTNGAGKSLLFGTLPVALYEADPLALAKKNKKDMHQKGSSIKVEFTSNSGQDIGLEQLSSGYKFFIDGKDQKVQKQDIAKEKLLLHWTLKEEEFYTTCYINSQRTCDFQKSKPTDRLSFITNLFDLHLYDRLRAHFAKMRTEIKDKETEYQTLAVTLSSIDRSLVNIKWNKVKVKALDEIKKQSSLTLKKLEALYKQKTDFKSSLESADTIKEKALKYFELSASLNKLGKLKEAKKKLESQISFLESSEDYDEENKKYRKKLANLTGSMAEFTKELEELGGTYEEGLSLKEISKVIDKQSDLYLETKDSYKKVLATVLEQEDLLEDRENLLTDIKDLGFKKISDIGTQDTSSDIEMAKASIAIAEDLDGHKNCPTCTQKINIKAIEKAAKIAEKRLPELKCLRQAQKKLEEYKTLSESSIGLKKLKSKSTKLETKMAFHKEQSKIYEKLEKIVMGLREGESRLDDLQQPKPPKGKISYRDIDLDQAEILLKSLDKITKVRTQLDTLLGQSDFDIRIDTLPNFKKQSKTQIKSIEALYKKTRDKIEILKVQSKETESNLVQLENEKSNWELLSEQKMELDCKMEEAQPFIKKKKIVETLFSAYGNTNLKLRQATKTLKLVEANLNRYSHMVFPETMVFNLEAGTRGIDALVTRSNGITSDISKLSGAETNCFRLLFAISILPLIPAERRTNFMILDEPDSACSDVVREHLAKEFVPKLRAIVPHVFWITPKEADTFKEAEVWTVQKHKGVSTLEVN